MKFLVRILRSPFKLAAPCVCVAGVLTAASDKIAPATDMRQTLINAGIVIFVVLGGVTLLAFLIALLKEGRLTIEAKWGILGGGNKGYSVSRATALFLLLLTYLVAFLGFVYLQGDHNGKPQDNNTGKIKIGLNSQDGSK